jgi:hypothetical protein
VSIFLRKFLLFCAAPALLFLGLLFLALAVPGRPPVVVFDRPIHTVIVGDSHCQCAVDDAVLPGVANLSLNSEGYIFSHAKLQLLFQQHPGIGTVFLGFSFHNLSSYYDDYIWGKQSGAVVRRYAALLTGAEKAALLRRNPAILVAFSLGLLPAWMAPGGTDGAPFIGAFEPVDTGKPLNTKSMLKRIRSQYYAGNHVAAFSILNRIYLVKIAQLCRAKGKRLVLLNTPLNEIYRSHIPPGYPEEYDALVRACGVEVVDFHDVTLPDDCFLPDGDHVNSRGARRVTEYLADYLREVPPAGGHESARE